MAALAALSACAHTQTASQPATQPAAYVSLLVGDPAPADGFFLSDQGAREFLKRQYAREFDLQRQLAITTLEKQEDDKALEGGNFWAKWGFPIGGAVGILVGVLVGGTVVGVAHR